MKQACILTALCAAIATPLSAQVVPMPEPATPRIQSVPFENGERVILTALPETALTVMLEPGERILRATLAENRLWEVSVSAESDSFQVSPAAGASRASLAIETDRRYYEFDLEVGQGLAAAYLVRFDFGSPAPRVLQPIEAEVTDDMAGLDWSYRLRGDDEVRPASIRDNGRKTVIEYAVGQALPAVFAIGPTGDEEVVDGHMRDGRFVIDRVHQELVFRIDKEKATARRNKRPDEKR